MSHSRGVISKQNPAKIIGIQFSILSPEEIRRSSVAEITSRDTYFNNKPVIGGLFDPRMGITDPGFVCPTDGLDYMQTPGYFGHIELARPVFYIQYLNTIIKIARCICFKCSKLLISKQKHKKALQQDSQHRWDYVFSLASKVQRCGDENEDGCGCKQPSRIKKEGLATIIAQWGKDDSQPISMKLSPEKVIILFRHISDEDVTFMGFSPLWSRPDWMVCQVFGVPPPAVRPSVKVNNAQQRSDDDITHIIVNIIKSNNMLQEKINQDADTEVIDDWHTMLQYYIATIINNKIPGVSNVTQRSGRALKSIIERLNGKGGRVRGNLMGKRVDFSARSVITPDASISIRELGVPKKIALNITYPERVNQRNRDYLTKLVLNGPDVYPGAKVLERASGEQISLRYVDRNSFVINEGDVVHRHMVDGDTVLFNRQPTLHRMSMMGHVARVLDRGDTFRMNVGDTKPYNADFDGDEMNMHNPQDIESVSELVNLAAVPHHIISPASNRSIVGIFQDSLLGCYRITRENVTFSTQQAMNLLMSYNGVDESMFAKQEARISSFEVLSQILPPLSAYFPNSAYSSDENKATSNNILEIIAGRYIRGQIDKNILGAPSKGLIQSIYNDFGYMASSNFIDNLQDIITEYMKTSAYSVGISDLIANRETIEKIAVAITDKKQKVKTLIDQLHVGGFENNTGKTNEVEFETKVNAMLNKAQEEAGKIGRKSLSKDNRFVIMVNAGSKGSALNIAQMVSCLGQQNVDGKRIPYGFEDRTLPHFTKYNDSPEARGFVEHSFIHGLTPVEMFFHAMGGRTGLIDTAVKTSTTGYIQRRLIKGLEDMKVCYDMTVRNNKNKIIQFSYGEDGINSTRTESQNMPLSGMTLDDVYAHIHIPAEDIDESVFLSATIKRMRKEKAAFEHAVKAATNVLILRRDEVVKHVFAYENETKIYIPVSIRRIIENVANQLQLQSNSFVDITPLETMRIIEKHFERLSTYYARPTLLFETAYYYHLTPRNLLMVKRFNKTALAVLLATIELNYKKSLVHPGEMVGMIAAQSIGEPTTQLTLNTFHFAGVASKSNVTRGVPRIEEILTLSEKPKNPSVTVYLKEDDEEDIQKAQEMMYALEHTRIRDIAKSVSICFDPNDTATSISEDTLLMEQYAEFSSLIEGCAGVASSDTTERSKWVIRLEMDRESMLDRNITMDEVHFALKTAYKQEISCVYSDFNADNLVFRIRIKDIISKRKEKNADNLDQSDGIYLLKNFQTVILDNITLRGIKDISKVILRKLQNNLVKRDGAYVSKESWVLDTVGTNLAGILAIKNIDSRRTYSNDIMEMHRVLGIEATRQILYTELSQGFDGTYINYHHLSLLCDRMTATEHLVSMYRHGINNDDIDPIAKASFEETPEMFLRAARHAQLDHMRGVSANVMCGQEGYFGTSSFQVVLDTDQFAVLKDKTLLEEEHIGFKIEDAKDPCSLTTIQIEGSVGDVAIKDTGIVSEDYDIGI